MLPRDAQSLTAGVLTDMVAANFPGAEALSAELVDLNEGTATKARLRVRWNAAGEKAGLTPSVIVKGGMLKHAEMMEHIYRKEVRYFAEIRDMLSVNSPRPFAAVSDDEAHRHFVVMEDLTLRDVRFCRVVDPISPDQAKQFLNILARMHAKTWDSAAFNAGGALADLKLWHSVAPMPDGAYAWGQLKPETWRHYMQLPRAQSVSRLFHDRDWMERALMKLNHLCEVGPFCFLHADFHLGNMYFDADGAAGVLDWQSFSKGVWSHDVTYFMCSALDMADRRKHDRDLLRYYLDRLNAEGVTNPPSFDEALEAFRLQIVDGLFYWMVNPVEWQVEVNNAAVAARFAAAALDHDTYGRVG